MAASPSLFLLFHSLSLSLFHIHTVLRFQLTVQMQSNSVGEDSCRWVICCIYSLALQLRTIIIHRNEVSVDPLGMTINNNVLPIINTVVIHKQRNVI